MNIEEYKKIVKSNGGKENKLKNMLVSFLVGGFMGIIGQFITYVFNKKLGFFIDDAYMYTFIILVVSASVLTGLGFFDKVVSTCKCGLIVPSTGFAHAMTSAAMDVRKEGFVKGIGGSIFKLTGSIILYGIVFAFIVSFLIGVFS